MEKRISVVLPVFNGEKSVKKAIESVLKQSYNNIELIIVNDCSTDETLSIVSECAREDERITIIDNKKNMKLPRSLNIGFERASGDYLTWTSDDNQYHNNAFMEMYDYLEMHEEIDLVYSDFSVKYMDGTIRNEEKKPGPDVIPFFNPVGACFLYRKKLSDLIGLYDPNMFLAEDYEYWIRAYLCGKLAHIDNNLYDYGWHDKSLTVTRCKEINHQTFNAKEKHFNELYDKCDDDSKKIRFLFEMLSLLDSKEEVKEKRKEYYRLNKKFAIVDTKRRLKELFRLHRIH